MFYRLDDESLTYTLIALLGEQYGNTIFRAQPVADTDAAERILLDESIDELAAYDDLDPDACDPPRSPQTMLRAKHAQSAERWAKMLPSRKGEASPSPKTYDGALSDDMLLQICRTSTDEELVTAEWMSDLRLVASLVDTSRNRKQVGLEHAVTLLAGCIGQLPQYNPTHLPFGYNGPTIRSHHWMDRDALEQVAKQIVGLIWHDVNPDIVASEITRSVAKAKHLGFMEQQEYDAWRPGMRSGSGWRSAVTATPYGMTKARGHSEAAAPEKKSGQRAARTGGQDDCLPSVADKWTFAPLDEGEVRASNQKLCSDYAALDEHDLLAISARWRQMAEKFTEVSKLTGHYHGYIVHDDEVFRVTKILETAVSQRKMKGVTKLGRCMRRPDDSHLHWALATLDALDARLRAEASTKVTPIGDEFEWARQVELVRATNQVLGQGELSKGVLSRACNDRLIETNGKSGQGSRAKVSSFLPWIARKLSLTKDEQTQIRNAIIGEITERNSQRRSAFGHQG